MAHKHDDATRRAREWNAEHAGKQADWLGDDGYRYVTLPNGRDVRVDVVAWVLQTGEEPPAEIIHKNGDRADSRWENLRLATDLDEPPQSAA